MASQSFVWHLRRKFDVRPTVPIEGSVMVNYIMPVQFFDAYFTPENNIRTLIQDKINDYVNERRDEAGKPNFDICKIRDVEFFNGVAPIHVAIFFKLFDFAQILIDRGADVNTPNIVGYTPLFIALGYLRCNDTAVWLLERGADPNMPAIYFTKEITLYGMFTTLKEKHTLNLLVKYGANPQHQYEDGTVNASHSNHEDLSYHDKLARRYNRALDGLNGFCANCGKCDIVLKKCSRCYSQFYCSKDCHIQDWKERHHKTCRKAISFGKHLQDRVNQKMFLSGIESEQFYMAGLNEHEQKAAWEKNKSAIERNKGKYFVVALEHIRKHKGFLLYNEDRSIHSWMFESDAKGPAMTALMDNQQKVYLWATPEDPSLGILGVFPGSYAPKQKW